MSMSFAAAILLVSVLSVDWGVHGEVSGWRGERASRWSSAADSRRSNALCGQRRTSCGLAVHLPGTSRPAVSSTPSLRRTMHVQAMGLSSWLSCCMPSFNKLEDVGAEDRPAKSCVFCDVSKETGFDVLQEVRDALRSAQMVS